MEKTSISLTGTQEVMDALKDLSAKLQANILRAFLRKAGNEKLIPKLKGVAHSRRFVKAMKITPDQTNKIGVLVGPISTAYIERFLNGGTIERKTKKGWNRGSIRGDHKIDVAVNDSIDPIIDFVNKELGNEVHKILERRLKSTRNKINKL